MLRNAAEFDTFIGVLVAMIPFQGNGRLLSPVPPFTLTTTDCSAVGCTDDDDVEEEEEQTKGAAPILKTVVGVADDCEKIKQKHT